MYNLMIHLAAPDAASFIRRHPGEVSDACAWRDPGALGPPGLSRPAPVEAEAAPAAGRGWDEGEAWPRTDEAGEEPERWDGMA